jgi:hypothetical protein
VKHAWLISVILALIIKGINCHVATAQCFKKNTTFREGESITYLAYYNWGFIWLNAGWVRFTVKPESYLDREVYHLESYGSSHTSYDWFFKVRDRYRCYLDKKDLRPLWFHRKNYEGGFEVDNKYLFNYSKNVAYTFTQNSDRPYKEDTIPLPPCTFDVLSLIYYCRNLDFGRLAVYDTIPVTSIIDNEIFNLYIRYRGRETIKARDGTRYRCIKFSALLVEGTSFKGGEDLFVWVTDDNNRVPVLVEAKIVVGSVKAYLIETKGLRYPIESIVTK